MKKRLLIMAFALAAGSVQAATFTWSGGTGGTWDTTAVNWTGASGTPWDSSNGPTNGAFFSTASLNNNVSGTVYANGITFNNGGTVNGGVITLAGANPFLSAASSQTVLFNSDVAGTSGLTTLGAGTITLQGAIKVITGGLTVNQGTLRLDLGTTPTGVAASGNTLTMSGSTLNLLGKSSDSSAQTLGNLTLNGGVSTISLNPNGGTGTTLTLGDTWTKNAGGTLLIDLSSASAGTRTVTSSPTLTNGVLGYAVVKDSTGTGFVTVDSGNVVRYTGATAISGTVTDYTGSATTNYTSSGTTFAGTSTTQTINSLEVTAGTTKRGGSLTTLVIGSGGVLFNNAALLNETSGELAMTSGTDELNIYKATTAFDTRVRWAFTDNGASPVSLVKSGAGVLVLYSTGHTYSGDTVINEGTFNGNIPSGAGKGNLVLNGGVFSYRSSTGYTKTINGLSNTTAIGGTVNNAGSSSGPQSTYFLDLGNNDATASFSGNITFGSIIKSGTGTQTLSGTNTYTGSTIVNGGTLKLGSASAVSASTSIVVQATLDVSSVAWTLGAGQVLSGTGTLVGAATVAGAVSPGTGGIGTLTASNVTWNAGVAWPIDLGASSTSDRLAINGAFSKGTGSGFTFDLQSVGGAGVYTLVTWSASTTFVAGDFAADNVPGGLTPTFTVNANELTLTLAGGGSPILGVSPASLDFGGVQVGSSSSLVFVVTNSGAALLTGNAAVSLAEYAIAGSTNFSVAPGTSADITITFTPSLADSYADSVTFLSDGGGLTNAITGYGYIIAGSTNASIGLVGGKVTFGFNLASGALYRVQASTNLLIVPDSGFVDITAPLTNRGSGLIIYTNTASDPAQMFRIQSP